jgi:hypothetical protein
VVWIRGAKMYHVLSKSENGNLGIKIDGKLTRDDYDLLIPN